MSKIIVTDQNETWAFDQNGWLVIVQPAFAAANTERVDVALGSIKPESWKELTDKRRAVGPDAPKKSRDYKK